jgi:tetratricopeptide (TPR) repeat protein
LNLFKIIVICLFFLFQGLTNQAQKTQEILDSLKINTVSTEKALIIINKQLSNTDLNSKEKAYLFEYKADLLKQEKNIYASIALYKKSFNINKQLNNINEEIKILNKVSELYIELEDYSKAITSLNQVEQLIEKSALKDKFKSSRYLANMAQMFYKTNEIKKAKKYFYYSFDVAKSNDNYMLLHEHFLDYADFNIQIGQLDSAFYFCDKVLVCDKIKSMPILEAKSHEIKGAAYEKLNDFILAEEQYKQAISALYKNGSNTGAINKKIGNFYKRVFLYDYADTYLKRAAKKMKEDNNIEELQSLYHDLLENSLLQKRTRKTLFYLKKYDSVHSIREKELEKRNIQYINERYNIQQAEINFINDRNTLLKKESELITQKNIAKKNRLINIIIIALLTVLFLIGYMYYRFYKLSIEKTNMKLKNTVLRLQMNPHFIFNSLTALQNSILKNDQLKSAELVAVFSKLIRQNLDFSNRKSISLDEEIDMLTNYLETQKFRFNDLFDFSIEIDPKIDGEETQIPPMLLQPFVENSIEHGLKHKEKDGKITVKITKINKGINIVIEDNGIGRKSANKHNKNHDDKDKIHAIKIFRERLKNRQKKEINGFKIIDVADKYNNVIGTKVEFNLMD